MTFKPKKAAVYKARIIKDLKALGTYRPEFDMVIETLAMIYEQRDKNLAKWEELDNFAPVCEYTNKAGATNLSKHPCYLNNLQYHEQILKYTKDSCDFLPCWAAKSLVHPAFSLMNTGSKSLIGISPRQSKHVEMLNRL